MSPDSACGVVQIGLVVADVEATVAHYRRLLAVTEWFVNKVDSGNGKGEHFHNRGRPIKARALIAWTRLGNVELELIQPLDSDSVYAEFLRDHGPGVHHVMFEGKDLDATAADFLSAGIPELAGGDLQHTRFKMFDSQEQLGLICEFAEGGELVPDGKI